MHTGTGRHWSELPHEQDAEDGAVEGLPTTAGSPTDRTRRRRRGRSGRKPGRSAVRATAARPMAGPRKPKSPEVPELRLIAVGDIMLGRVCF